MGDPPTEALIGARLREVRSGAGMSQAHLAEAAVIPQYNLSRIETGSRRLGLSEAARIASVLDISVVDLLPRPADA